MSDEIDYPIDLFDHRQTHVMWGDLADMRQRCPVAHLPDGLLFTSRYDDVQKVFHTLA